MSSSGYTPRSTFPPLPTWKRGHPVSGSATRAGFTLIELLVVIAIIGLLAAVLVPVLNSVRAKGHTTDCISNMRQIGGALALYTQSYKGRYPVAPRKPSDPLISLRVVMVDQLPDKEVWSCPADQTFAAELGLSYEWNSFISGQVLRGTMIYKLAMSNAAAVPVLSDFEKVHDEGKSRVVLFADGHAEELR